MGSDHAAAARLLVNLRVTGDKVTLAAKGVMPRAIAALVAEATGATIIGIDSRTAPVELDFEDLSVSQALDRIASSLPHQIVQSAPGKWELTYLAASMVPTAYGPEAPVKYKAAVVHAAPAQMGARTGRMTEEVYSTDPATGRPTFEIRDVEVVPPSGSARAIVNPQEQGHGVSGEDRFAPGPYKTHEASPGAIAPVPVALPPIQQ
jgi:hypothetical protein